MSTSFFLELIAPQKGLLHFLKLLRKLLLPFPLNLLLLLKRKRLTLQLILLLHNRPKHFLLLPLKLLLFLLLQFFTQILSLRRNFHPFLHDDGSIHRQSTLQLTFQFLYLLLVFTDQCIFWIIVYFWLVFYLLCLVSITQC